MDLPLANSSGKHQLWSVPTIEKVDPMPNALFEDRRGSRTLDCRTENNDTVRLGRAVVRAVSPNDCSQNDAPSNNPNEEPEGDSSYVSAHVFFWHNVKSTHR